MGSGIIIGTKNEVGVIARVVTEALSRVPMRINHSSCRSIQKCSTAITCTIIITYRRR